MAEIRPCHPPAAGVNRFGDLVCPACRVNIVTPPGAIVIPGRERCPACGGPLRVSVSTARRANRRAVDRALADALRRRGTAANQTR